ncbi:MAG: hypothetical protein FWG75_08250 [Cystobacterineae bacterium]|nr:hypothetical protein [Cystobacterineae bacterium]
MSMAVHLAGHYGLTLSIEDGELLLDGLQQLSLKDRAHALHLARENRLPILAEVTRAGGTLSNPYVAHYRATCPDYWQGCESCPDATPAKLDFCRRHPILEVEE